jgi:hypothetical protein
MAKMYPCKLFEETESHAERRLYKAFRDGLDDSYTVFHAVAWQSLDEDGRRRDGEADFVIAHREGGVLVLEAKGGQIDYDARTRHWVSVDRKGHAHSIRDPFAQARESRYVLQDAVKAVLRSPQRWINIGQAVAFPDVLVDEAPPGLDRQKPAILDAADLADVSGWVSRALNYWRGQSNGRVTAPGEEVVQALVELLAKDWELRPALWGDVAQEQQQLIRLTERQYLVLDTLSRQRRAAVCGCAGSGKTMLAAEKAVRLARQGFRVLLTCFNKNLAAYLRTQLKHRENLDIVHFHRLCMDLARKAHVEPERPNESGFFSERLPNALIDAIDVLHVSYDAIIVDEGQDFLGAWWIPLEMLLKDQDGGIFYVFYDDNQRIYDRQGELPVSQPPYPLPVNCRNTQHIHDTILRFYDSKIRPTARGPQGRPVEVVEYSDSQQVHTVLASVLRRLQVEDRVPSDQIVVLTPLSRRKSSLWASAQKSGLRIADKWPAPAGQVCCSTIHAFKGLEASVVVLAEAECLRSPQWTDADSLLYVACSRACSHLIVLLPSSADARLRQAFAPTETA